MNKWSSVTKQVGEEKRRHGENKNSETESEAGQVRYWQYGK